MNSTKSGNLLAEIDDELADLETRKTKLFALRGALEEYQNGAEASQPDTPQAPPRPGRAARNGSPRRAQTVTDIMEKAGRPMTMKEIIAAFWDRGLDLDYKDKKVELVNILSSSMIRSGRFHRVERGVWWFIDRPVPKIKVNENECDPEVPM